MSNETAINATEYALDKRAEEIAHQILVAAGSGINHYTSQSRERIVRKAREQIEALSGRTPDEVDGLEKVCDRVVKCLPGSKIASEATAALAKYRGEA